MFGNWVHIKHVEFEGVFDLNLSEKMKETAQTLHIFFGEKDR
jgi:hypothetical protein